MTIFLLAVWRKALPALPISIAFGLLFYFVSAIMLVPYTNLLVKLPSAANGGDPNQLYIGIGGGGGVYV